MTTFQEAFEQAEASEAGESEAVEALDEGSAIGGETAGEGTGEEVGTAPASFDLEQYGDQVVTIKVDGVDQQVPVSELRNGYMRQAAFTQHSQQLASERTRLSAAESLAASYERNPVETVRFLAQQNGLTFAEAKAQAEEATEQTEGWANEGYVDPRVDALEQRIARLDEQEARQELTATLDRLGKLYGDDFDQEAVVKLAIKLGTTDIEAVYKQNAFDRQWGQRAAEQEVATRTAEETATRTAAKASLASTVATGQSFAGAGSTSSLPITTIGQAFDAAVAEHGDPFGF